MTSLVVKFIPGSKFAGQITRAVIGHTQPVGLSGDEGRHHDLKCDVEPFYVAQNENEADLVESQAPNSL